MEKFDLNKMLQVMGGGMNSVVSSITELKENLEILKASLELIESQEEELPKIIEGIRKIALKNREVNGLQLKAAKSANVSLAIRQAQAEKTSLALEQDLLKDLSKYEMDLLAVKDGATKEVVKKAIQSLEEAIAKQEEELINAN